MKRESRYYVFKISDVHAALTADEIATLNVIENILRSHRIGRGACDLRCVVVEHDWPEYEPTWKAIESRVDEAAKGPCVKSGGDGELIVPVEMGAAVYECPACRPDVRLPANGEHAVGRVPSAKEAHECVVRLVNSHFRRDDKECGRFSIPARPDHDDDLLLGSFIDRYDNDLATCRLVLREVKRRLIGSVMDGDDNVRPKIPISLCAQIDITLREFGVVMAPFTGQTSPSDDSVSSGAGPGKP